MTAPESQAPAEVRIGKGRGLSLVRGTRLTISIPTEISPQAWYTFALGYDLNPLGPTDLILVGHSRAPFVNTSLRFLNGFDYLFDADDGFAGFRWSGHAEHRFGRVISTVPAD